MKKITAIVLLIAFVFSMSSAVFSSSSHILGDLDDNGIVSSADSLLLRRYLAEFHDDIIEAAADVNLDGRINSRDSLMLKKHIALISPIGAYTLSDEIISEFYINGVNIRNYNIIVPDEREVYVTYAAEILQDFISDKSGITVPVLTDTVQSGDYEFLIGPTNRQESISAVAAVSLDDDDYLLKLDGSKIVMLGESYMIGAPVGAFTYDYVEYDPDRTAQLCNITTLPTSNTVSSYQAREAKSALLMIGDGMGPIHAEATLYYNSIRHLEPDYTEFSAYRLPCAGKVTTYSFTTNESGGETPTDSAAAGTALACGYKTFNTRVGIDFIRLRRQNIRELAASLGKRNAVISTDHIYGATPASFTAHTLSRTSTQDILDQQAQITDCDYMKGDITDDLLSETKYTLDLLSTNNENGYFAMIEEGYIDKSCHSNLPRDLVHYMARFNSTLQYTMVFASAHPDLLLIVTADHECGGVTAKCVITTDKHTGVDVDVLSIGGGSEQLTGTIDNIFIPKLIASNWGVTNFGMNLN